MHIYSFFIRKILLVIILAASAFAQTQPLRSFIETNNGGNNYFGYSTSNAGDVNNDGFDDIIVGAYGYSSMTGRVYIYYGGSSMDTIADIILTGEGLSDSFGYSVSGAGDVNNDGYDDVIVGAIFSNLGVGRAYIYFGGSSMDTTADVIMTEGTSDNFGYSVSSAGDVNNDGYDDVIVGAIGYGTYTGRAYIYYGGSSMNSTADVTLTGEGTSNFFGISVSGAGDVNNDGFDDVIVGADRLITSTGRAYIYYGGNSMDTTADVTMSGETTFNYFGRSVSYAGDVNNDGYGDVIVGAYGYGASYIYYGGSNMDNTVDVTMTFRSSYILFGFSVSGAGDVNNDGYDDVIVGGYDNIGRAFIYFGGVSMNNVADVTITGQGTGSHFGISVSDAGDVNNDGFDDVIIGADGYQLNGKAYLYNGNTFTSIESASAARVSEFKLGQNYPNPFNPSTTITFSVPERSTVTLKIYDLLGKEVATLINNEIVAPGSHTKQWNASALASGVYFYKLRTGTYIETKKLVLLR